MAFVVNDFGTTELNTPVTIDILSNDFVFEGEFQSIDSSSDAGGTVVINDAGTPDLIDDDTVTYTPPTGFQGIDQFTYSITDNDGADSGIVFVAVDTAPFNPFDPGTNAPSALVDAIVAEGASLSILSDTISFTGGFVTDDFTGEVSPQTSFYDGSLPLGIGAGILLTSGDATPPLVNTVGNYSVSQNGPTDPDLQAVANSAFENAGTVEDANLLEFSFTVDDPSVKSVTFDLVFASDEFPEFSNSSFVDVAAVFVNGENVALFNNDETQPLSIIDRNLSLGNFIDNESGSGDFALTEFNGETKALPIEYDGVSAPLTIFAPVQPGTNTVKIGVGDTGDQIYDSALFVSDFATSTISADISGVLLEVTGTEEDDDLTGTENNEFFTTFAGNDILDPGAGNDVADLGPGDDTLTSGQGNNTADGGDGVDTVIYNSLSTDFDITVVDDNTIQVVGSTDAFSGSDLLQFFEQLQFDDQVIQISDLTDPGSPEIVVEIVVNTNANDFVESLVYDATPTAVGTQITTTLTEDVQNLGTDAVFANLVGLYETTGTDGGIDTNGDGVADLLPGDQGYARAAIQSRVESFAIFAGGSGNAGVNTSVEEFGDVLLEGGKFYAPFVIANGANVGFDGFIANEDAESSEFNNAAEFIDDLVAYFAFGAANPDAVDHLQAQGNGVFGFEDLPGGGDNDFNDAVFQLAFTA